MSQLENGLLIFVVDDEKLIASTLTLILTGRGFYARSFFDPLDALQAAQSTPPDLLLSDVVMPNMNGIELAIRMKQLCPDCRILLSSGQVATSELLAAARLEGHHFDILAKPVHPNTLLERLQELFNC
ncbi:MAG TPA: response regulator [Terracidiphilus sp.]|jgi:CheY-like chemotaxis protein|nr:response regulator [Terracidiphilus sp.]